jgi:hypothetical protein
VGGRADLLGGLGFLMLTAILEATYSVDGGRADAISDLLAIGTDASPIGEPSAFVIAVSWIAEPTS